ncbi:hypothetical protein SDJN02_06209, partial [Cucurbita argyrosperma subsp. argyrosperma]
MYSRYIINAKASPFSTIDSRSLSCRLPRVVNQKLFPTVGILSKDQRTKSGQSLAVQCPKLHRTVTSNWVVRLPLSQAQVLYPSTLHSVPPASQQHR